MFFSWIFLLIAINTWKSQQHQQSTMLSSCSRGCKRSWLKIVLTGLCQPQHIDLQDMVKRFVSSPAYGELQPVLAGSCASWEHAAWKPHLCHMWSGCYGRANDSMTNAPTFPSPIHLPLFHTLPFRGVIKGIKGRGVFVLAHWVPLLCGLQFNSKFYLDSALWGFH